MPKQFCPVPGCKNPAAPTFGMVCAAHKGVAKSKIRKYREARRAKKLGLPFTNLSTATSRFGLRGRAPEDQQGDVVVSAVAGAADL